MVTVGVLWIFEMYWTVYHELGQPRYPRYQLSLKSDNFEYLTMLAAIFLMAAYKHNYFSFIRLKPWSEHTYQIWSILNNSIREIWVKNYFM